VKKVVIVTGASRGIGAATARKLAEVGYVVCINYLANKEKSDSLVKSINAAGGEACAFQADISSEKEVKRLFLEVDNIYGPVSALVNNAANFGEKVKLENISVEDLQAVFNVNVIGTILCCREGVRRMKKIGSGAIVNVTSEAARGGGTNCIHYAASKSAINTLTIGVAREVAEYGIRVNAVSPGIIDTDITSPYTREKQSAKLSTIPMGREGKPGEVANTIVWVLSSEASYVSGAVISVSGAR